MLGWYKEKRRRTYIKPYELKAWWGAVYDLENDTYRDLLLLLLFTGLRQSEGAGGGQAGRIDGHLLIIRVGDTGGCLKNPSANQLDKILARIIARPCRSSPG